MIDIVSNLQLPEIQNNTKEDNRDYPGAKMYWDFLQILVLQDIE